MLLTLVIALFIDYFFYHKVLFDILITSGYPNISPESPVAVLFPELLC